MKLAPIFSILPLFFYLASDPIEAQPSSSVSDSSPRTTPISKMYRGSKLCRSRGIFLDSKEFMAETCARCYIYIPFSKFKTYTAKWNMSRGREFDPFRGTRLTNGKIQVNFRHLKRERKFFSVILLCYHMFGNAVFC